MLVGLIMQGDIGVLMVGTFKPAICKYSGVRLKNWRTYALEVLRKHHHVSCGTVNINIYSALVRKVVEVELIMFVHGVENSLDQVEVRAFLLFMLKHLYAGRNSFKFHDIMVVLFMESPENDRH
ncbi:hypothetical protein Nepgr_017301 [Nepenthes gracilis]|uniref:Uncharacterized protein n=1 Tax=Nepenthes gracilis TaxID=150966 RepID=A0AAD3SR67_NEPGR|nr:hypothetical protein Nepgr_017301 [Nepenthes gracilis]